MRKSCGIHKVLVVTDAIFSLGGDGGDEHLTLIVTDSYLQR